jgi:hypothetical protein
MFDFASTFLRLILKPVRGRRGGFPNRACFLGTYDYLRLVSNCASPCCCAVYYLWISKGERSSLTWLWAFMFESKIFVREFEESFFAGMIGGLPYAVL